MTEVERRLTELVNNRSSHSNGKYGPHVDGVKVSDLRALLSELETLRIATQVLDAERRSQQEQFNTCMDNRWSI